MKILAINGSHRGEKGFCHFLIGKLFEGAAAAGAHCETVCLADMKMNQCTACSRCKSKEHHLKCIFDDKDDVRGIFNKMKEADILVYATPVYVLGMTGKMKCFFDRINATGDSNDIRLTKSGLLFHHVDHAIYSKPFVSLVCCDNVEDDTVGNVLDYFNRLSKFLDAPYLGAFVRKSGKLVGHGRSAEKEAAFPKIKDVYAGFVQAGRELAGSGRIRKATFKRTNQNILPIPFMAQVLFGFRPVKRMIVAKARRSLSMQTTI